MVTLRVLRRSILPLSVPNEASAAIKGACSKTKNAYSFLLALHLVSALRAYVSSSQQLLDNEVVSERFKPRGASHPLQIQVVQDRRRHSSTACSLEIFVGVVII